MNVTGLNGDSSVLSMYALYGTQATDAVSALDTSQIGATTSASSSASNRTDSTHLSRMSEFLSKLQQLKSSDPEKFKQICTDIANKLKTAAQQLGDKPGGKMLSDLAAKFENVANGGDISQLQPSKPPSFLSANQAGIQQYAQQEQASQSNAMGGHSHHHHHGGQGGNSAVGQVMSSIFDEVDQATADPTAIAATTT